jgi:outer membrane protein OmpA-like peptidoglycan-associated protein
MEPVKDEGLFPTLKKKFLGFIGKEEPPAVSQPPIDVPEPMPAPATDVTTPDMSTSADVNGLPELPALDSTGASEPLPSLGAEAPAAPPTGNEALEIVRNQQVKESDGLPSLPEENEPASAVDMPELPDAAPPPPTVTTAIEPIIEQEVAALPPARQPAPASTDDQKGEKAVTVPFALSEMEVPIASQDALKELARQLTVDKNKIVTVVAYASAPPEQSSLARRVSLARALAVRAFLIDLGVDNIRINVQSLGNSFPEGTDQTERADIFLK